MRKLAVFSMTALAAVMMAGAPAMTSQASMYTFCIPTGMSGNGTNRCPDLTNLGMVYGGCNSGTIFGDTEKPGNGENKPELPEKQEADSYAEEVLELVNAEREKAGVGALTLSNQAQKAADVRAAEIQREFSHTRPDGSDFSTALTAAGIRYMSSGENIAYGQNSPKEVMQGWMNSSGHRANILNRDFTSIGIGHMETADGVDYWTQLFYR